MAPETGLIELSATEIVALAAALDGVEEHLGRRRELVNDPATAGRGAYVRARASLASLRAKVGSALVALDERPAPRSSARTDDSHGRPLRLELACDERRLLATHGAARLLV